MHPAGPRTHDVTLARAASLPLLLVVMVAAGLGAWQRGSAGAWAALLAGLVVAAFFGSGLLVSARTARVAPALGMALAVAAHGAKVLVCGGLLIALGSGTWFDRDVLALTLVAATMAWLAGQVRGFTRLRIFSVEPEAAPASTPTRGSERR